MQTSQALVIIYVYLPEPSFYTVQGDINSTMAIYNNVLNEHGGHISKYLSKSKTATCRIVALSVIKKEWRMDHL